MGTDQAGWAEAHELLSQHDTGVFSSISARIIEAACDGDEAGLRRWEDMHLRVVRLLGSCRTPR